MSTIIHMVHDKINHLSHGVDKTVDSWLLMSSPLPLLGIISIWMVFVLKIGPAVMANRKPFNLKNLLIFYNAFQVILSTWLCYTSVQQSNVLSHLTDMECESKRDRDAELGLYSGAWFYFFSKVIDLLDTIFFVLRKKQNQVTFLHVYHHSVTAFFSWGYLKYAPGEQGVVIGILNSFVHIIMYFYYMVSAMGPQYQKYLWWKKYMTSIQLVQFVLILGYMLLMAAKDCQMPKQLTFFFVINTIIFLYLFSDFYRKTYQKNKLAKMAASNGSTISNGNGVVSNGKLINELDVNNNAVKPIKQE